MSPPVGRKNRLAARRSWQRDTRSLTRPSCRPICGFRVSTNLLGTPPKLPVLNPQLHTLQTPCGSARVFYSRCRRPDGEVHYRGSEVWRQSGCSKHTNYSNLMEVNSGWWHPVLISNPYLSTFCPYNIFIEQIPNIAALFCMGISHLLNIFKNGIFFVF